MARNMPPEGTDKNGVAKILDDLFVTKREKRLEEDHSSRISRTQEVEKQDLRVTEEDLRTAIANCDPRKAAGVEGEVWGNSQDHSGITAWAVPGFVQQYK